LYIIEENLPKKKDSLGYNKGTCTPTFVAAQFTIAKP
jgi:hypothetical protein